MIQIAFYKGPAKGFLHKLSHALICIATLSRYSHCELVIGGYCYSSSWRDGGVRAKKIDLNSGKWHVVDVINGGSVPTLRWFDEHMGAPYDWRGVIRFLLPFVKQKPQQYFCSEAVAAALGLELPHKTTPQDLCAIFGDKK